MILLPHICWLLILHLPVYSQASNHAESCFRFGPDYEYKYGTVPKRKDKHILRANRPKWMLKNIDKPKFVFFGQNLLKNIQDKPESARGYIYEKYYTSIPPRKLPFFSIPRFTIIRRKNRTRTHTKPTSEPTRTPNREEKRTTIAPYEINEEDEEENSPRPRHTTTKPHRPKHTTTEPHRPSHTTAEPHRPSHTTAEPHRPSRTTTEPHRPSHTTTEPHRPSHTTTKPRQEVTTQTTATAHKSTTRTHTPYTTTRPWYVRFKDTITSLWPWSN